MTALTQHPALVLNADLTPLSVVPLSVWDPIRTLRNVLSGRVIALEHYDAEIASKGRRFRPASVVALTSQAPTRTSVPFTRMNILIRDGFCCQYCGTSLTLNTMTFDHVIPRSHGGGTDFDNIVSCCARCNTLKGDRLDMKPLRRPQAPSAQDILSSRPLDTRHLHRSWLDVLYWSGVLEST